MCAKSESLLSKSWVFFETKIVFLMLVEATFGLGFCEMNEKGKVSCYY